MPRVERAARPLFPAARWKYLWREATASRLAPNHFDFERSARIRTQASGSLREMFPAGRRKPRAGRPFHPRHPFRCVVGFHFLRNEVGSAGRGSATLRAMIRLLAIFLFLTSLSGLSAHAAVELGIDVLKAQGFAPLAGKRVGLVTNQTGVDSSGTKTRVLLRRAQNVQLVALYSPEHGIDGTVLAGKYVPSRKDAATGLVVHSLYGPTRKPTPEMLRGIDVLVYDMQDIGVRSYTYVSTMAKCMEACGEQRIPFVVLDRPNPLGGQRVEGPGIEEKWKSFVGQLPVPYLHGMTVGELAKMANAHGWAGSRCQLTVVPMQGWSRDMTWSRTGLRWVQTSPNIPRATSVPYYAATSIFGSLEGAALDVGIGTGEPFQCAGKCNMDSGAFVRELRACGLRGSLVEPYTRKEFGGARLSLSADSDMNLAALNIHLLSAAQRNSRGSIFARYRDPDGIFWKIYGSTGLRAQIEKGVSPAAIIASWDSGVARFLAARQAYLLY